MSALIRVIWQRTRANLTFSHIERSSVPHTHNDATKHTVPCTGRAARALSERMVQIHEHGTEYCLSDDKVAAALARVKKLQRREPSQLPPCRRLQLTGVGCEPRDPPGLCRSQKTSPARLRVMLMNILTCPHRGRCRPTSRVACVTVRRVRGVKRGCACAAGAGRLPPVPRRHLVDEDVMTSARRAVEGGLWRRKRIS